MSGALAARMRSSWEKNAPELFGLFNGALPPFVHARQPRLPAAAVPVFAYHRVSGAQLREDLAFLARNGYRALSGHEFLEHLSGRCVQSTAVVLSFDDGPRNFYLEALPALSEFRARAIAFIAPGLHSDDDGGGFERPMTWQEITAVHETGLIEFQSHTLESRFVPRWPRAVPLVGCSARLQSQRRGAPLPLGQDLERSRWLIRERLPGALVDQLAFPAYRGTPLAVITARMHGFRACYWGLLAGRDLNRPGDSPFWISRLSGEFLRRLPGSGRVSLRELIGRRLHAARSARRARAMASEAF